MWIIQPAGRTNGVKGKLPKPWQRQGQEEGQELKLEVKGS